MLKWNLLVARDCKDPKSGTKQQIFFCEMRLLKAKNNIVFDSDLVWQMQLMIIIG